MALLSVAVEPAHLPAVSGVLAETPAAAVNWTGRALHLAYERAAQAAEVAGAIRRALGVETRIAGHYGLVEALAFPEISGPVIVGRAARMPDDILGGVPSGACHVSATFAAAACAADPRLRAEPVGELDAGDGGPPVPLLALRA